MKKFIYFVIIIFLNHTAFSIELHDALAKAYANNTKLQLARNSFLTEIEQFSTAFSGFLPRVSYRLDTQMQKVKRIGSTPSQSQNARGQEGELSIEQYLFSGGRDMARLKAAQLEFQASRARYYMEEQNAIADLIKTYLNCYEAKEKYEISSVSVKAAKQQLELTEEQLNLGEATLGDLALAKSKFAKAETEKLMVYAALQQSNAIFVKQFGMEIDNIKMPLLPDNVPTSMENFMQKAIKLSPYIDTAKYKVQSTKAMELATKAELLPTVSLKITNSREFNPDSFNKRAITSLLRLTVPIYSQGVEYSNIRKAKNHTRSSVIQLDDAIKSIQASVISKWEEFESAKSRIQSTTQGVEAAQIDMMPWSKKK